MDGIIVFATIGRVVIKTVLKNIFNDPVADIADEYLVGRFGDYLKARKAKAPVKSRTLPAKARRCIRRQ